MNHWEVIKCHKLRCKTQKDGISGLELRGCQLSMTTQKVLMTTQIISWVVMMTTQLFFVPLSCSDRARVIVIKSFLVLFVIMYMYIESSHTHPSIMKDGWVLEGRMRKCGVYTVKNFITSDDHTKTCFDYPKMKLGGHDDHPRNLRYFLPCRPSCIDEKRGHEGSMPV